MMAFPDGQNMFMQPDNEVDEHNVHAPVPSFDRRTAAAGFDGNHEEHIKNISISSLNLYSNRKVHKSLGHLCSSNDQSEQFILEDFTKYTSKGIYKAIAIIDTDTEEEGKSDKYDTD